MNHAIAILGYRAPEVLRAVIPLYRAAGLDIFIHVDEKVDLEKYVGCLGELHRECCILPVRMNIRWAGFSMVRAEMALVRFISSEADYARISLVSDDTVPLVSPSAIRRFFQNENEFISIRKLGSGDPFLKRYESFYFFDDIATALRDRTIENAEITNAFVDEILKLKTVMETGKQAIDIYYGSQWWSLTKSTVQVILQHFESNSLLRNSFEYSAVPDEMFVQTIVGNFVPRDVVRNGPVYVDWTSNPKPFVFKTKQQINERELSKCVFLRKVSVDAHEILTELRDELLHEAEA